MLRAQLICSNSHLLLYGLKEWLRLEGTSECHLAQPMLEHGHLERAAQVHIRWFPISPRRETPELEQPVTALSHLHAVKVFPCVQTERTAFHFVLIAILSSTQENEYNVPDIAIGLK